MKTRLPIIILLFASAVSAEALWTPMYRMDSQILRSDVVVYCEEVDYQNAQATQVKCKVMQTFKGDVSPGSEVTVGYTRNYLRSFDDTVSSSKKFPLGKVLLFLRKESFGASYEVLDAKLVQDGKVFRFFQESNPGFLVLKSMQPENIKLAVDQKYGEKELLEDFAVALKKSASLKAPVVKSIFE